MRVVKNAATTPIWFKEHQTLVTVHKTMDFIIQEKQIYMSENQCAHAHYINIKQSEIAT